MFAIGGNLFGLAKNDLWEGSEGTSFEALKEQLIFIARECSRPEREVQAEYNRKEQWVELKIVGGDLLAIVTLRSAPASSQCIIITSFLLTEREKRLIDRTFAPIPTVFIQ